MAFGLKMRKFEKAEIEKRIKRAADILGIDEPAAPQAAPALGRPAPARGARPRHRARSQGLPVRRAALQPRRQAARADAGRAQEAARAAGRHLDLRHPRPGRGDDAGRPRGGDEGRRGPAGRRAARALQHAGQPLRRGLHRLAGDELRRRDPGRRTAASLCAEAPGLKIVLPDALAAAPAPRRNGRKATLGIRPEDIHIAGAADSAGPLLRGRASRWSSSSARRSCSTRASAAARSSHRSTRRVRTQARDQPDAALCDADDKLRAGAQPRRACTCSTPQTEAAI